MESNDIGLQLDPMPNPVPSSPKHPNLIIDFDSRFFVEKSGSQVLGWTDKAKGITVRPPTTALRPTLTPSVYNNIPAILFDSTCLSWEGRIPELEGISEFTIIVMSLGSKLGSNSCSNGGVIYQVKDAYSTKTILGYESDNTNDTQLSTWVRVGNGANLLFGRVDNMLGLSTLQIIGWTFDGRVPTGTDTFKCSVNGGNRTNNSSFSGGIPRKTFVPISGDKCQLNIGCATGGAGFSTATRDGHLVRVQIYNREIPIAGLEYKKIVSDLMNEYNLIYKRQVLCFGDSRTHNSNHQTTNGWVRQAQLELGESAWLFSNGGLGLDTIANAVSVQSIKVYPQLNTFKRQIVCVWYGRNDIDGGATAATVYTNLYNYCQNIKTNRSDAIVILFTELPSSSGNPNYETTRQTLNTSIRTEASPTWDYIADIGNDATIGQAGQNTNATYYVDTIHPGFAGDTIIASYVTAILINL